MNKLQPSQDDCQGSPSYRRNRICFSGILRFIAVFIAAPFSLSQPVGHQVTALMGAVELQHRSLFPTKLWVTLLLSSRKKKKQQGRIFFPQDKQVF